MPAHEKLMPLFSSRHSSNRPEPGTKQWSLSAMTAFVLSEQPDPLECIAPVRPPWHEYPPESIERRLVGIERAVGAHAVILTDTRHDVVALTKAVEGLRRTVAELAERNAGRGEVMLDEMIAKLGGYAGMELDADTEAELLGLDE